MSVTLNDVHSQLNATCVVQVHRPCSLDELIQVIQSSRRSGMKLSQSGGKHAMGGQQFFRDSWHIDTSALDRVLHCDAEKGLLQIEAGAHWPAIIEASHTMACANGALWSIGQKQTGVDAVSLGGSICAGMRMVVDCFNNLLGTMWKISPSSMPTGKWFFAVASTTRELFSLVIGGYGMFGVIYAATLRLMPRQCMKRIVEVIDLDDAMDAVFRRTAEGCTYGDFQFVIDPNDRGFLHRGVFACYQPSDATAEIITQSDLTPDHWLELLRLAHEDKTRAFRLYAEHYMSTHGNHYWSDTMQLSTYLPSYAEFLESKRDAAEVTNAKESLIIGEHYVPRENLLGFMSAARLILQQHGTEVIYGTIRAIFRDTESYLPWAKQDYACVIFNLRTPHHPEGIENTANTFRALMDAAIERDGSFFLTYHRFARVDQVEAAHPRFREWLRCKKCYDSSELFMSEWYAHYRDAFAQHEDPL